MITDCRRASFKIQDIQTAFGLKDMPKAQRMLDSKLPSAISDPHFQVPAWKASQPKPILHGKRAAGNGDDEDAGNVGQPKLCHTALAGTTSTGT